MLWEASVLDPNEVRSSGIIDSRAEILCLGNTIPWLEHP
jgi:hypothetical protein